MEGIEEICFNIITSVGSARSDYIEAIQLAKKGDFTGARAMMESGSRNFAEGHRVHADLIAKEASGEDVGLCMILIHAEDQLMSAEGFGILAEEFLDLYQKMDERKD